MKYRNILGGLVILAGTYGCGNSSAEEKTDTNTESMITVPIDTTAPKPADSTTVQNTQVPGGATVQIPATPTINTSMLNPEHGKPGHRCEIAVGAPLNSKPTTTTTPAVTTSPVVNNPISITPSPAPATAPAATSTVAPGMNPAHGQPGHRCDIAVGAPLSSKPAANTPTVTQPISIQPPSSPATTPVVTTSAPVTAPATGPGLNPAHGQPGHRCDIAVGAPLNSEPKKN